MLGEGRKTLPFHPLCCWFNHAIMESDTLSRAQLTFMPSAGKLPGPLLISSCIIVQFNLDVEELDIAQRELDYWRRDPSCPMIIEVAFCARTIAAVTDVSVGAGSFSGMLMLHTAAGCSAEPHGREVSQAL